LAGVHGEHKRNFFGQSTWEKGYFASTISPGKTLIREYIRDPEQEDKRMVQVSLWRQFATFRWRERGRVALATLFSRFERLK
jgi:hypothetical protein